MHNDDEPLLFLDERDSPATAIDGRTRKVPIVDDDEDVPSGHGLCPHGLEGSRSLLIFLHAYSAAEALSTCVASATSRSSCSMWVMESEDAGLCLRGASAGTGSNNRASSCVPASRGYARTLGDPRLRHQRLQDQEQS